MRTRAVEAGKDRKMMTRPFFFQFNFFNRGKEANRRRKGKEIFFYFSSFTRNTVCFWVKCFLPLQVNGVKLLHIALWLWVNYTRTKTAYTRMNLWLCTGRFYVPSLALSRFPVLYFLKVFFQRFPKSFPSLDHLLSTWITASREELSEASIFMRTRKVMVNIITEEERSGR